MRAIRELADRHAFIAPLAPVVAALLFSAAVYIRSEPVKLLRSEITPGGKPGDHIVVRRYGEWKRADCVGYEHQFVIEDSLNYPHVPKPEVLGDIGAPIRIQREFQIPFKMAWGDATVRSRLRFACFPFFWAWPVKMEHPPLRFHVSPP